jgi:hypothetical protein
LSCTYANFVKKIAKCSEMNYRGKGCLTLKEPFRKDFRLGLGIILVFICLNFRAFFSPDSDICVFHVVDHEVEEY